MKIEAPTWHVKSNIYRGILVITLLLHSQYGMPQSLIKNVKIDKIVVYKGKRTMEVFQNGQLLKKYNIALGFQPKGHKHFQGDGKTPEGTYKINGKNPNSQFHKNLGVSYPNSTDMAYARSHNKSAGGDIKVHGIGKTFGHVGAAHTASDWTLGCIAVTNEEIDEIYAATPIGTPIVINP